MADNNVDNFDDYTIDPNHTDPNSNKYIPPEYRDDLNRLNELKTGAQSQQGFDTQVSYDQSSANYANNDAYAADEYADAANYDNMRYDEHTDEEHHFNLRNLLINLLPFLVLLLFSIVAIFGFVIELSSSESVKGLKLSNLFSRNSSESAKASCDNPIKSVVALKSVETCNVDGIIKTKEVSDVDQGSQNLLENERSSAESGQVIYRPTNYEGLQKWTTGNELPDKYLPEGVVMYGNELDGDKLIINNANLKFESTSADNAVLTEKVSKFLNGDSEYTGDEPLGVESSVLSAYDVFEDRMVSNTINEIDIANLQGIPGSLSSRAMYGVDTDKDGNYTIVSRLFLKVRDNYLLVQHPIQDQIASSAILSASSSCGFEDVPCVVNSLKSNDDIRSNAESDLIKSLNTFKLR